MSFHGRKPAYMLLEYPQYMQQAANFEGLKNYVKTLVKEASLQHRMHPMHRVDKLDDGHESIE
ncbi:hypothetical protein PISMIDRAFT_14857 [Pisolithus microcarpus 441]|uniref:Uncharacterized protein n=1 Tax=Pisolithus microcarpus 441 TaxID=765257 RepID=A0A0C9ZCT9_9AGAM|nr:hypothetical protein PISMIDRAFT_14857 [Pisolithus microcarpus 441]